MRQRDDIVETTRVRLARNFIDTPFAAAMNDVQARDNRQRVKAALGAEFTEIDMKNATPLQRTSLVEAHLISRELAKSDVGALFLSRDERIAVMVNEEDHVRIQCILPGLSLSRADELTSAIEAIIGRAGFAFDDTLGYLTSCPTNVGTAMRASVMLHLPALTRSEAIPGLLDTVGKFGFALRGFYGEGTSAAGCMYQLSNQVTLGVSEDEIIQSLETAVRSIVEKENAVSDMLLQSHYVGMMDMICRSVGLLKYCRTIESADMMRQLSNVKLGVGLGVVGGITVDDLRGLIIKAQPATLQMSIGAEADQSARDAKRAELVRDAFAKCEVDSMK